MRTVALVSLFAIAACLYELPDHVTVPSPDGATSGDANPHNDGGLNYPSLVIDDGPLSYWRFGDKGGAVARDEMGKNSGTYEGQPGLGVRGLLPNEDDTAVHFDGNDDLMTSQANAYSSGGDFTLEALVFAEAYPTAVAGLFCAEEYNKSGFRFGITNGGTLQLWASESGGTSSAKTTDGAIALNTTYHVAAVRAGAEVTVYVNGAAFTGNVTIVPTPAGTMVGGTCESNYFKGVIDEAAVYAKALSADRIAAHAHAAGLY